MEVSSPFDLSASDAYARWRSTKLASEPRTVEDLMVAVRNPLELTHSERAELLERLSQANMVLYRSKMLHENKAVVSRLGTQLGLVRLDANWLADEDGVSSIQLADRGQTAQDGDAAASARQDYIPYTDLALGWHTDGYYHPANRRIQGMILHCVRPALQGGVNSLVDHERIYIALRDANPAWVKALMAPDAMTIPQRQDESGVARAAQSGPVFSVRDDGLGLHMRYTSRTRSIQWKPDATTLEAVAFIRACLDGNPSWRFQVRLDPGMGIVANNVLHARSGFSDDPRQHRLIYRARYLDHAHAHPAGAAQELAA